MVLRGKYTQTHAHFKKIQISIRFQEANGFGMHNIKNRQKNRANILKISGSLMVWTYFSLKKDGKHLLYSWSFHKIIKSSHISFVAFVVYLSQVFWF